SCARLHALVSCAFHSARARLSLRRVRALPTHRASRRGVTSDARSVALEQRDPTGQANLKARAVVGNAVHPTLSVHELDVAAAEIEAEAGTHRLRSRDERLE